MAKKAAAPKFVYCYNCGHRIEVGRKTMSTSCPGCSKPVIVEDIVVKSYKAVVNVETCGKLVVPKRGRVVAQKRIVAHGGIEVEGSLQCGVAISAGPVSIGPKAEWKGDLRATSLLVKAGAKITNGYFEIPNDPLADYRKNDPPPDGANGETAEPTTGKSRAKKKPSKKAPPERKKKKRPSKRSGNE